MLKYSEIATVFNDNNINIYEYVDETNEDITLPLLVYIAQDGEGFEADSVNYIKFINVAIVMIDETMNFAMQRKIENILYDNEVYFEKNTTFSEEERLYSVTYTIQVFDE